MDQIKLQKWLKKAYDKERFEYECEWKHIFDYEVKNIQLNKLYESELQKYLEIGCDNCDSKNEFCKYFIKKDI